ncbi:unnamed protein product [Paramecium sonneborni]|uniref:Uncharacterized protein n=1 Tax=Paramecium sonneborni TaxID=65129 RepID=A0A8S1R3R2_9CILI|nr:unnamed protein product [Paramecium sonneborni]
MLYFYSLNLKLKSLTQLFRAYSQHQNFQYYVYAIYNFTKFLTLKVYQTIPIKCGPYLVDPKDIAYEVVGVKQVDDTMSKINL